jgi:ABC-type protease/lipase transport system fused ATPase/permease subunit
MPNFDSKDPVTLGLRASARQLAGVAVFSGVVNLLTLSGSLYMLQVYDRVIPSRNVATLVGLSLIVLVAYLLQGYFVFVLVTSRAALISLLRTTNTPLPREEGLRPP